MLLGFGSKKEEKVAPAQGGNTFIFDATTDNFETSVLQASQEKPVLVDFWAPWCGPCKQLMPVLEQEVAAHKGAVLLAKVNIDENPELAQLLRVQSVPTVFAFFQGQPVTGFAGAQPASQIRSLLDQLVKMARQARPDAIDIPATLEAAEQARLAGDFDTAQNLYGLVVNADGANAAAYAGLVRVTVALGHLDHARAFVQQVPDEIRKQPVFAEALSALELAAQVPDGSAAALEARLSADPGDHACRFDLALLQAAEGRKDQAVDNLMQIIRQNRDWEDGRARTQLLKFFEAWGAMDPATLAGRRKLSSLLFS